ncbi:MAG: FecR domain-containing protein [Sphingobacteriia bacterium]|nr:FecR domain-containing protein [Sphingobacteriia bacterium]
MADPNLHTNNFERQYQLLLDRYVANLVTEEELAVLVHLMQNHIGDAVLEEHMRQTAERSIPQPYSGKAPVRRLWLRYASVAAVLVIVLAGAWYWKQQEVVKKADGYSIASNGNSIDAGTNRAILKTSDGKTIVLDSTAQGIVNRDAAATISNQRGRLDVTAHEQTAAVAFNTITTPRGGQYQLVLADGTEVWLDANSSIVFPSAFVGKERKVVITGQAYFEVAKDAAHPFKVEALGETVEVLGTHFNINAYGDQDQMITSLLEGRVKLSGKASTGESMLQPGQQAVMSLSQRQAIIVRCGADMEEVVAWKNGLTFYRDADMSTLIHFMERWYGLEIKVEGVLPDRTFYVDISRHAKLSALLKLFDVNHIKYRLDVDRKTLTLQP